MDTVARKVQVDGKKLRYYRHLRLMSAQQLAKEAGLTQVTVLHLENHPEAQPHPSTVRKLVEALQVEPKDLIRD